jgi:ABC-type lipoprotein release transport system permease subunit
VIYAKMMFGGLGRRGFEAISAAMILTFAVSIVVTGFMIVAGSRDALLRAERADRPDVVHVKGRYNRALFETPRSGNLPPLTLPVYEPLVAAEAFANLASNVLVLPRQSLLRNVVTANSFLNTYVFGIEPEREAQVSRFSVVQGRFLRPEDENTVVVDQASARALGVGLGDGIAIRKADGFDLKVEIVGILDNMNLHNPPPRTVDAPALDPDASFVSSGIFVTLRTSQVIFGRTTLTDALLVAPSADRVPAVVDQLHHAFRLEPGVFVTERYARFRRKVHDFAASLAFFLSVTGAAAGLSAFLIIRLLHDVYAERRQQLAILSALGFSPARNTLTLIGLGMAVALSGAIAGMLLAVLFAPRQFAMPSLMADLGSVEPRLDRLVLVLIAGSSALAIGLGLTPTVWRLTRHTLARELADPAP